MVQFGGIQVRESRRSVSIREIRFLAWSFSFFLFPFSVAVSAGQTQTTYECLGTTAFHSSMAKWANAAGELSSLTAAACLSDFGSTTLCTSAVSNENGGIANRSSTNPCPTPPSSAVFLREGAQFQPDGAYGHIVYRNYVGFWSGPSDPYECGPIRHFRGSDPNAYDVSTYTYNACLADFGSSSYCTEAKNPPTIPANYQHCISSVPATSNFVRFGSIYQPENATIRVHFYFGHLNACPDGAEYDSSTHECVLPPDPEKNLGESCGLGIGNPINLGTGNKYQREYDYCFQSQG